jgi:hypothetical protein
MAKNTERRGKRSYASMSKAEATALLNKRLIAGVAGIVASRAIRVQIQQERCIRLAIRDLGEGGHFKMTSFDEEED